MPAGHLTAPRLRPSHVRSLWRDADRRALVARLRRLAPDARPRWGRLTAPRLLAHLADSLRFALGDVDAPPRHGRVARLLRRAPAKQLVVYWLPFPRHAPQVAALFATPPGAWAGDLAAVEALLDRAAAHAAAARPGWPEHPFFGRLTTRAWGVLGWRHMDHHLRQFGV